MVDDQHKRRFVSRPPTRYLPDISVDDRAVPPHDSSRRRPLRHGKGQTSIRAPDGARLGNAFVNVDPLAFGCHRYGGVVMRARILAAVAAAAVVLPVLVAPAPAAHAVAVNPADFQQVTLAFGPSATGEPMSLAVLPDRSVLHTARDGTVRLTDADGETNIAGRIPVYTHDEEGLQGIGIDPDFAHNRAVFLYYSPPLSTPAGDAP